MTAIPWPDHLLTLDEWDALPEDTSRRYELIEGVLLGVPRPTTLHQLAMLQLAGELNRQLPDDLVALPDVEVVVEDRHPATVRAPDVVVVLTPVSEGNPARLQARDVQLAVEVVSPGTRRTDQVTKPAEYAEAGIADYWLVDLGPPTTLTAYTLVNGEYELTAEGSGELTLLGGSVRIHVDRLTSRR